MAYKDGDLVVVKRRKDGTTAQSGLAKVRLDGKRLHVVCSCHCCTDNIGWWPCSSKELRPAKKADILASPVFYGKRRSDYYQFYLLKEGERVVVRAGCRTLTFDQAKAHWGSPEYRDPGLGKWSLKEVARMKKEATKIGWIKTKPVKKPVKKASRKKRV